jgi:hypothetical protein
MLLRAVSQPADGIKNAAAPICPRHENAAGTSGADGVMTNPATLPEI